MQLTLWSYEGPPHVGAMRVATSLRDVHLVIHAPQGDTYADLLFTMIERHDRRPPVTWTTFQARDLGGDTAGLVTRTLADACTRHAPRLLMVCESCTGELIQDQPGALALGMDLGVPVVPVELNAYARKENWGAAESLYQLARSLLAGQALPPGSVRPPRPEGRPPRANIVGPTALGFRCRDDLREVEGLLRELGIEINAVVPLGADPDDIRRLPEADFNVDLYPEVSRPLCRWLERSFGQPATRVVPMGLGATRDFVAEVARLAGVSPEPVLGRERPGVASLSASRSRMQWYARSVDSTYLTGKRVFVFGDATHAVAAARVARDEMGFEVVGLGTYSRELAREVREAAATHGVEALITDDYLEVEAAIAACAPELVLGTQMERHVAKRLGIACAVISAPMHVQDVPARYSPVFGFEGANVLFDTWVHPLVMGLEEHLLAMFRDDFEFHDERPASHLGVTAAPAVTAVTADAVPAPAEVPADPACRWEPEAEAELRKVPFFVRGKARRNTERFARERGLSAISIDTLYDAKAHFGR